MYTQPIRLTERIPTVPSRRGSTYSSINYRLDWPLDISTAAATKTTMIVRSIYNVTKNRLRTQRVSAQHCYYYNKSVVLRPCSYHLRLFALCHSSGINPYDPLNHTVSVAVTVILYAMVALWSSERVFITPTCGIKWKTYVRAHKTKGGRLERPPLTPSACGGRTHVFWMVRKPNHLLDLKSSLLYSYNYSENWPTKKK